MPRKKKIFTDKAGNSLVKNPDKSFSVENALGKRVTGKEFHKFIKKNKRTKKDIFNIYS